ERAVRALELRHGPVHAEMRVNEQGVWMLETAARPIGGLCARVLPGLEELIVRHAVGEDIPASQPAQAASGVMMIPIPKAGVYESVEGVERSETIQGVESVEITASRGQRLVPLPEGSSYLGFIFSRAESPEEVEQALRRAHAELRFSIA